MFREEIVISDAITRRVNLEMELFFQIHPIITTLCESFSNTHPSPYNDYNGPENMYFELIEIDFFFNTGNQNFSFSFFSNNMSFP